MRIIPSWSIFYRVIPKYPHVCCVCMHTVSSPVLSDMCVLCECTQYCLLSDMYVHSTLSCSVRQGVYVHSTVSCCVFCVYVQPPVLGYKVAIAERREGVIALWEERAPFQPQSNLPAKVRLAIIIKEQSPLTLQKTYAQRFGRIVRGKSTFSAPK